MDNDQNRLDPMPLSAYDGFFGEMMPGMALADLSSRFNVMGSDGVADPAITQSLAQAGLLDNGTQPDNTPDSALNIAVPRAPSF